MGIRSRRYLIPRAAFAGIAISLLAVIAAAQQPKVLAPHDPIAPEAKTHFQLRSVPGSIAGGPWIVDAHDQSILYLKNVVENASITVAPVLHLSDGTKYQLPAVQLAPSGIAKVDIGASLESMGIAPIATLSGWVEIQYNWPWEPLCAYLRVVDLTRSMVFSFGFSAPGPLSSQAEKSASQVREGMWWKQEKNVTGFLTLANTTPKAMNATVQIEDNLGAVLGSHAITVPPQGMATLDLLEMQTADTKEGGICVSYVGAADALLINGGLEDVGVGYSANLPFAAPERTPPKGAHAIIPQSFAELGLMTGQADPYMSFPAGTIFTPYSLLRNVSLSPITVTPTLWWMQGAAPASFQLPSIRLLPSQTYRLDMPSLLASAGLKDFSGSLNMVFDTQGQTGLLMAAGSVDKTNTYVFEVASRGVVKSAGKSLSYWSTGNGDDTMITIWNPADEEQTFIFRLVFAGGHYDDLMTLGPRATAMFDISDIIRTAGADAEGNIIPPGTQEGSAKIVGIEAENQNILLAVDSGIYNVRKATCYTNCPTCDGSTLFSILFDPFGVAASEQTQESFVAQWNTGAQYDYTTNASWNSSNTSIATVQTGLVNGISPGDVIVSAGYGEVPLYASTYCAPSGCPLYGGGSSSAGGSVASLSCTTVTRGGTTTCTATGPTGSTFSGWKFDDGSGGIVTSSSTNYTWSGIAVQSGTVSVTIKSTDGGTQTVSRNLTVVPRQNWSLAAKSSVRQNNPYTCSDTNHSVLSVPNTPVQGSYFGLDCPVMNITANTKTITDGGPNNGYSFVTGVSDNGEYSWIIAGDVDNPQSQFYQAQCGNYNPSTGTGFISGATLDADAQRHEGGTTESHYAEYSSTYNNASYNPGIVFEPFVEFQPNNQSFVSDVSSKLNAIETSIYSAAAVEPCHNKYVGYSSSCNFDGPPNYAPSCN